MPALQRLFEFLLELQRDGYNDYERETDSDLVKKLRTNTIIKVDLICVTDRMAAQIVLHGSQPYAAHPSLHSIVPLDRLGNLSAYYPVTKTLDLWNLEFNQGIDRSGPRLEGVVNGGMLGLASEAVLMDTLHGMGIRTEVRTFQIVMQVMDSVSSTVQSQSGLAKAVWAHWLGRLKLNVYRMGEADAVPSTNVAGARRWLLLGPELFRIPTDQGQELALPALGVYLLETFLDQVATVHEHVMGDYEAPLELIHVDCYVYGVMRRVLFSEKSFTQTDRTIIDNASYMVHRAKQLGINLNDASTQNIEKQHEADRLAVFRKTRRRHDFSTMSTVLTASEFQKDYKEESMSIPFLEEMVETYNTQRGLVGRHGGMHTEKLRGALGAFLTRVQELDKVDLIHPQMRHD